MIGFFGAVLVALVALIIAAPLWGSTSEETPASSSLPDELWTREKAVAMLAITEADFDRATGKLSDADYTVLREDYEDRALRAIDELEKLEVPSVAPSPSAAGAHFCGQCGNRFQDPDRFCSGCGAPRS